MISDEYDITGKKTVPQEDPHGHWKKYVTVLSPAFALVAMVGALAILEPRAANGILSTPLSALRLTAPSPTGQ